MSLKITYFFRKPSENFHSIEELFNNFQPYLSNKFEYENIFLPFHNGFINRIKNIFFAKKNQNQINHITGDINYIAFGLPKKNTVLTIHDIGSIIKRNFLKRFIINLLWFKMPLKRVKYVTVISEFSKQEIIYNFKINEEKIIVIPNCVSNKFVKTKRQFNNEYPNILFVGTKPNKNLERSIEALKKISCKFFIIGKLNENQLFLLKNNNIDYVNFVNLSFDEVIDLYQQSDILLFPSLYEGFGVPILEAQATGIPVITSDLSPMKEVANNSSFLLNPLSIDEIHNAILQLIENKTLREKLIEKGFENVKKYSAENIAKKYEQLYKDIIS
jgi:glycosyltransferase involved in cell wall biosynthesis